MAARPRTAGSSANASGHAEFVRHKCLESRQPDGCQRRPHVAVLRPGHQREPAASSLRGSDHGNLICLSTGTPGAVDPVARTSATQPGAVARIRQPTPIERQAAAADALAEAGLKPLELGNALANIPGPPAGELRP